MTEEMKPLSNDLIDALLADYKKPEDLIGQNGLLKQLTKALVERALQAELTDHLGPARISWSPMKLATPATDEARRPSKATLANCPLKSPATVLAPSSPKSSPSTRPAGAALTTRFCRCTPVA
jgi:putative transposase